MNHRPIKSNQIKPNQREQKSNFEKNQNEKTYVCDYCKKVGHLAKFCYALGYKNCVECKSKGYKNCVCPKEVRADTNVWNSGSDHTYTAHHSVPYQSNGVSLSMETSSSENRKNVNSDEQKCANGDGFNRRERDDGERRGKVGEREKERRDSSADSKRKGHHDDASRRENDHEAWDDAKQTYANDESKGRSFHHSHERGEGEYDEGRRRGRSWSKERTSRFNHHSYKDTYDDNSHDSYRKENGNEYNRNDRDSNCGFRGRGNLTARNGGRGDRENERSRFNPRQHHRESDRFRFPERSGGWNGRNDHSHTNGHHHHHTNHSHNQHHHHRESSWYGKNEYHSRDKKWMEGIDHEDSKGEGKGHAMEESREGKEKERKGWESWIGDREKSSEKLPNDEFLESKSKSNPDESKLNSGESKLNSGESKLNFDESKLNSDDSNLEMGEIVESPVKASANNDGDEDNNTNNHHLIHDNGSKSKVNGEKDDKTMRSYSKKDEITEKVDEKKDKEVFMEEDEREEGELPVEEEKKEEKKEAKKEAKKEEKKEEKKEAKKEEGRDEKVHSGEVKHKNDMDFKKENGHGNKDDNDYDYVMTHFRHKKFNYNRDLKSRKMNEKTKSDYNKFENAQSRFSQRKGDYDMEKSKFGQKKDDYDTERSKFGKKKENYDMEKSKYVLKEGNDVEKSKPETEIQSSSSQTENSDSWYYNDCFGNLQGPLSFSDLKRMHDQNQIEFDYMVRKGNSNNWLILRNILQNVANSRQSSNISNQMDRNDAISLYEMDSQVRTKPTANTEPNPEPSPSLKEEILREVAEEVPAKVDSEVANEDACVVSEGKENEVNTEPEIEVRNEPNVGLSVDERVKNLMQGFELSEADLQKDEKEVEVLMLEAVKAAIRRAAQAMKDEDQRIEKYLKERAQRNNSNKNNLVESKERDFNHNMQLDSMHIEGTQNDLKSSATESQNISNAITDKPTQSNAIIISEEKSSIPPSNEKQSLNVDVESVRNKNTVAVTVPHLEENEEIKMQKILSKFQLNFLKGGDWMLVSDPFLHPPLPNRQDCFRTFLNNGQPLWEKSMVNESQSDPRVDPSLNSAVNQSSQSLTLLDLPKWASDWPQGFGPLTEDNETIIPCEKVKPYDLLSLKVKIETETAPEVKHVESVGMKAKTEAAPEVKPAELARDVKVKKATETTPEVHVKSESDVIGDHFTQTSEPKHASSNSGLDQTKSSASEITKIENSILEGMEENEANAIQILSQGLTMNEEKSSVLKTVNEEESFVSKIVNEDKPSVLKTVKEGESLVMKTVNKDKPSVLKTESEGEKLALKTANEVKPTVLKTVNEFKNVSLGVLRPSKVSVLVKDQTFPEIYSVIKRNALYMKRFQKFDTVSEEYDVEDSKKMQSVDSLHESKREAVFHSQSQSRSQVPSEEKDKNGVKIEHGVSNGFASDDWYSYDEDDDYDECYNPPSGDKNRNQKSKLSSPSKTIPVPTLYYTSPPTRAEKDKKDLAEKDKKGKGKIKNEENQMQPFSSIPHNYLFHGRRVVTEDGKHPSLPLTEGGWCYPDGMGGEKGYSPYWRIQSLVKDEKIVEGSSIFRKEDNLWLPATLPHPLYNPMPQTVDRFQTGNKYYAKYRNNFDMQKNFIHSLNSNYQPFSKPNNQKFLSSPLPPSLLSFIYGKLHEKIMHLYRSKLFKASISEALGEWIQTNSFKSLDVVSSRLLMDGKEGKGGEREEEKKEEGDGHGYGGGMGWKKEGEGPSSFSYNHFSAYKRLNAYKNFNMESQAKSQKESQMKSQMGKGRWSSEKDLVLSEEEENNDDYEIKKSMKRPKGFIDQKKSQRNTNTIKYNNNNSNNKNNDYNLTNDDYNMNELDNYEDADDDVDYSPPKVMRSDLTHKSKSLKEKSIDHIRQSRDTTMEGIFSETSFSSPDSASFSAFDSDDQELNSSNHHHHHLSLLSSKSLINDNSLVDLKDGLMKAEAWMKQVLDAEKKTKTESSEKDKNEQILTHGVSKIPTESNHSDSSTCHQIFDIMIGRCMGDVCLMTSSMLVCRKWNTMVKKWKVKDKKVNFSTVFQKCTDVAVNSWIGNETYYKSVENISFKNCTHLSLQCIHSLIQSHPSIVSMDIRGCNHLKSLTSSYPMIRFIYKQTNSLLFASKGKRKYREMELSKTEKSLKSVSGFENSEITWGLARSRKQNKKVKLSQTKSQRFVSMIHEYAHDADLDADVDEKASLDNASLDASVGSKTNQQNLTPTCSLKMQWKKMKKNAQFSGKKRKIVQEKKVSNALKRSKSEDSYSKDFLSAEKDKHRNGEFKFEKSQNFSSDSDDQDVNRSESENYHSLSHPKNNFDRKKLMDGGPSDDDDDFFFKSNQTKSYHADSATFKDKVIKDENMRPSDDIQVKTKDADEDENEYAEEDEFDSDNLEKIRSRSRKNWGNRMTQQSMVPPVTRTYETIDKYVIVTDKEDVERKMAAQLPDNFEDLMNRMRKQGRDEIQMHLDLPQVRESRPRKVLGKEVEEQEVYGIDPYTHNLLLDSMPTDMPYYTRESERHAFIEDHLLPALNEEAREKFPIGKATMSIDLIDIVSRVKEKSMEENNLFLQNFCNSLLSNMLSRSNRKGKEKDSFLAYRKGLGVVCAAKDGIDADDFVVEFFGEVYPPWRWFEKQDGIRKWQNREPITEFYNIILERPRGDALGFDVLVVDAMHKANYASRLCHSCRPNCEAKVAAIDGKYMIGVFSIRPIKLGEELTFNYMSVTENMEEFNQAVCLCGNRYCKGSYLDLGGASAFQQAISEQHGTLTRYKMLVDSFSTQTPSSSSSPSSPSSPSLAPPSSLTEEEQTIFQSIGFSSCLFKDLPPWMIKYIAQLAKFITWERQLLPEMLLNQNNNIKKKSRKSSTSAICHDNPSTLEQAKEEAEGVFLQRMQSIAITVDKVRYYLRSTFLNPSTAPPPLLRLDEKELVSLMWSNENSIVCSLLKCLSSSMDKVEYTNFRRKVLHYNKPGVEGRSLKHCLLWLRDELLHMECSGSSRHDAAADLIHLYAYTKYFFKHTEYPSLSSSPIEILPSDLGRSLPDNDGSDADAAKIQDFTKTYDRDFVLGQLLFWFKQSLPEPSRALASAGRGCLVLPEPSSCYSRNLNQPLQRSYGAQQRNAMIDKMASKPQKAWPKPGDDWLWEWKNLRSFYGSPMFDAVLENRELDAEMMEWLNTRPIHFIGPFDLP